MTGHMLSSRVTIDKALGCHDRGPPNLGQSRIIRQLQVKVGSQLHLGGRQTLQV